jgi:uncharacterized protein (TIGR03083 family)
MYGALYREGQARIVDLATAGQSDTIVPACPDWSVTDVVRHVAGLAGDVVAGHTEGYGTDEWTNRQVEERRGEALGDVIAAWDGDLDAVIGIIDDADASGLPEWMSSMGGPMPRAALPAAIISDLTQHEHDVRHALRRPGARRSPGVVAAAHNHVKGARLAFAALGLPTLRVEVTDGDEVWDIGRGEPVAVLRTSVFELLRATGGRRTLEEIAAYEWEGDSGQFVAPLVLPYFSPRETPLGE